MCEERANAGINIYALATSDTVDQTVVRMVVSDPTKALMLLGEAGVLAWEIDVHTIENASEPGVVVKLAERLAEAEVNIEYTYLAAGPVPKGSDYSAPIRCRKRGSRSSNFKDGSRWPSRPA